MTRNGILVSVALCVATFGGLHAEDELAITELYGQSVHAYFNGSFEEAHKSLSDAIELGTDDPRVFYFRGLAKLKLGRAEEAAKDFEAGGKLEAQGAAQYYPVGRSLERIQGAPRASIEKIRKQARIQIRLRKKKIESARIEAFKRDEKLRNTGAPVQLGTPADSSKSEEDPFGTTGAATTQPKVETKPTVPTSPPKTVDPFAQPDTKAAPAKTVDPFAQPDTKAAPAKTDDPFAQPDTKTAPAKTDDPFAQPDTKAAPAKTDDPFAAPEKKESTPAKDPFAEPKKKADSSSSADPFAEPDDGKADAGSSDDPFADPGSSEPKKDDSKADDDPFK